MERGKGKGGTKWRLISVLVFCALARRRKRGIVQPALMWTLVKAFNKNTMRSHNFMSSPDFSQNFRQDPRFSQRRLRHSLSRRIEDERGGSLKRGLDANICIADKTTFSRILQGG